MVEGHLGKHSLETFAPDRGTSGDAKIIVNHHDAITCPSKFLRHVHEAVLQLRGLLIPMDLLERGLPNVDDCGLLEMARMNLLWAFLDPAVRHQRRHDPVLPSQRGT